MTEFVAEMEKIMEEIMAEEEITEVEKEEKEERRIAPRDAPYGASSRCDGERGIGGDVAKIVAEMKDTVAEIMAEEKILAEFVRSNHPRSSSERHSLAWDASSRPLHGAPPRHIPWRPLPPV